ncbi:MAG: alanine--tRNA ligase-related protein, partial [Gammaproteobacteria bacterium]
MDRGEEAAKFCEHPGKACGVNVDGCARFIELGNLVFIQYNRDAGGKLTPLPMRHVDTGTGLERVTSVMQSLESGRLLGNYDIDVFQTIIRAIEKIVISVGNGKKYGSDFETDVSYRAIADHARTISFLIADGVLPGNTDREYVLRRLISRSARHGRQLGLEQPFLAGVADAVGDAMGKAYPELVSNAAKIRKVVSEEETRFGETLDRGLELIDTEIGRLRRATRNVLPGEVAFKLYDTYGFPLDLTEDVLRNSNFTVDVAGFYRLMEEQRERGRAARKDDAAAPEIAIDAGVSSRFIGNHIYDADSEIVAAEPAADGRITLIAAETPFYPEGGGQTGDRGIIETESGALA